MAQPSLPPSLSQLSPNTPIAFNSSTSGVSTGPIGSTGVTGNIGPIGVSAGTAPSSSGNSPQYFVDATTLEKYNAYEDRIKLLQEQNYDLIDRISHLENLMRVLLGVESVDTE